MGARVSVRGVWKSFTTGDGEVSALEDMSFTVGDGEFVSIVGPSGCGKSTLLNVLAGFERADRGDVLIDGRPIRGPSRRGILITQRGSVFPWMTVRRNLELALNGAPDPERRRIIAHHVNLVGLGGFGERYPHELSGGMLQRVEVARALVAQPDVLYMDEPFGALDALTRLTVRNELLRIITRDGPTCLLVTHDVEEALHVADRVFVMTSRPARVAREFEVAAPRPRRMHSTELVGLRAQILTELGVSAADAA